MGGSRALSERAHALYGPPPAPLGQSSTAVEIVIWRGASQESADRGEESGTNHLFNKYHPNRKRRVDYAGFIDPYCAGCG